jgi:hypothetical protein
VVFADEFLDSTDLCSRKSAAALQPDWIKPELCNFVVPLNVTMLGLIAIPCVKEETIWTDSQYGRHLFQLHTNFFSLARSYQILKTSWTLTRLIIKPQAARRLRERRGVWPYASTSFPFLLPQVGKKQNSQIRKVGSAHPMDLLLFQWFETAEAEIQGQVIGNLQSPGQEEGGT